MYGHFVHCCVSDVFCFYCLCLFCFFFKQKTAYEMRISDWSSDVCSSDLVVATVLLVAAIICASQRVAFHAEQLAHRLGDPYGTMVLTLSAVLVEEIGRASCRERVCQYV